MSILPQIITNSVIAGAIYSIVAIGFNLIFSTVKFFDIGYGAITAVGGYSVFFLMKTLGVELWISVLAGVVIAGATGYLIYRLVYSPLKKKNASNIVLLLASLGVFIVVQAVIAIFFTSQFQILSTNVGTQNVYNIFGGLITQTQLIILIFAVVLTLVLSFIFKKTKFGKMVKAIGDNEEIAKTVGINTQRVIGIVFTIGSAIAGLAGILVGFNIGIEPTMGMSLLLKGVVASIIGGIGNIYGGIAGGFFLGFVENFGTWGVSGEWKDVIVFTLLIIFLIFKPNGIFNK